MLLSQENTIVMHKLLAYFRRYVLCFMLLQNPMNFFKNIVRLLRLPIMI